MTELNEVTNTTNFFTTHSFELPVTQTPLIQYPDPEKWTLEITVDNYNRLPKSVIRYLLTKAIQQNSEVFVTVEDAVRG